MTPFGVTGNLQSPKSIYWMHWVHTTKCITIRHEADDFNQEIIKKNSKWLYKQTAQFGTCMVAMLMAAIDAPLLLLKHNRYESSPCVCHQPLYQSPLFITHAVNYVVTLAIKRLLHGPLLDIHSMQYMLRTVLRVH